MKIFTIYESIPDEFFKDATRRVESFETVEDAKHVLKALEEVNVSFNYYYITEETK